MENAFPNPSSPEKDHNNPEDQILSMRGERLRIYRRVSKKNYLHGKAVYEYERFYLPVPKMFQHIVRPFVGKDLKVKIEPDEDGFVVKITFSSRPKDRASRWR